MKEVKLTRGYVAVVDDEDFERVNAHKWNPSPSGKCVYATRRPKINGKYTTQSMHRFILGVTAGEVDHIDHDGLNNQRANLRLCSRADNQRNQRLRVDNTSGFKGVNWRKASGKWHAKIMAGGKLRSLGFFADKQSAAAAYAKAASELHGEFAYPSIPRPPKQ